MPGPKSHQTMEDISMAAETETPTEDGGLKQTMIMLGVLIVCVAVAAYFYL